LLAKSAGNVKLTLYEKVTLCIKNCKLFTFYLRWRCS